MKKVRPDQKSVTIRRDEWDLAKSVAEKKGQTLTSWIREIIRREGEAELEALEVPQP